MAPDGSILGSARSEYGMQHPASGWADQNPADYRSALASVIREVVSVAGIRSNDVSHLALSSQVDGVVPIGADLRPLCAAIIWLDRRAIDQVDRLAQSIGEERTFQLTGLNLDATHTAPKIMWLKENEPEVYAASASLPSVGGYALAWLVGRSIQDHANSSSSLLYDLRTRDWSDELVDAAGIDRDKLPEIGAAHDVAGTLTAEAAEALGLDAKCRVVVGTGDDHASCIGAGGTVPGVVIDILGTAEPVGVASDALLFDETKLLETHAHGVDGSYLIENPGFVSGGNTLWFAKNILGVGQQQFFDLADRSEPGARGVRFLPALSGSMAPRWNDHVRGSFAGLSMNHDSSDLARAIVEANAFAFRDIYDRLGVLGLGGSVRVVGGGARSSLWLQAKATICRTPIYHVTTEETSATGAAMLAGFAAGHFAGLDDAVDRVVEIADERIEPDESQFAQYDEAYAEYRSLFDALEARAENESTYVAQR